jgi:hypothetical protein
LQHEEDHKRGQRDEDRARGEQVVVGEELSAQVVERAGDGELVTVGEQHGRPEELVVDPGHLQRRQRGDRRPAQRQGELEELPRDVGAVDLGRLVDLVRDRLHVVAQHQRAEADLERRVDQDQPEIAVEQLAVGVEPGRQRRLVERAVDRDQQRLRRQQVGRDEEAEEGQVELEAEAGQDERDARGQEQGEYDGRDGDVERVEELLPELPALPRLPVVVEGEPTEREVAVRRGVVVVAERVEHAPQQGRQPADRHDQQKRVQEDPRQADRRRVHRSPRVVARRWMTT